MTWAGHAPVPTAVCPRGTGSLRGHPTSEVRVTDGPPIDGPAVLRPDRGAATRWTVVGATASVLALWIALDAGDSVLAWAFTALCLVLTAYVAAQLARPDRFQVRLDAAGVEVALPWQHARIPWGRVQVARVVSVAGEPVLELHVWDHDDPAQAVPRATGILLPLGADLDLLHARLGRHLGVSGPGAPAGPNVSPAGR